MSKPTERDLKWLDRYGLKGRSPLYKYIRKNFAKLQERKAGTTEGPSWAHLAEWLALRGQTNSRGEPLSADAVRKVFTRVSRDIEAEERQRRTGIAAPKQNRMPRGWTPPLASKATPVSTQPSPFAPTAVSTGSGGSGDMTPEELRAGVAEVIAKRSGR